MLERTEVEGRPCTVAYISDQLEPASKAEHAMVKVTFDDGEVLFLRKAAPILDRAWDPSKHPKHPKGAPESRGGQFARIIAAAKEAEADRLEAESHRVSPSLRQMAQEKAEELRSEAEALRAPAVQEEAEEADELTATTPAQHVRLHSPMLSPGAGLEKYSAEERRRVRADMSFSVPKEQLKQPGVTSLKDMLEKHLSVEAEFMAMIEQHAYGNGAVPKFPPSKGAYPGSRTMKPVGSIERKLRDELNGDYTQIKDLLRATVMTDTVEHARLAALDFVEKHGAAVLRVKDRFAEAAEGYRDILINFKMPNGMIVELQFNSDAMLEAKGKGGGHDLYRQLQLLPQGDLRESILKQQMKTLYDNAYHEDGNGDWAGGRWGDAVTVEQDLESMYPMRFRVENDQQERWLAELRLVDGRSQLWSDRLGVMQPDDFMSHADLLAPEFDYNEWTIIQY